MAVRGIVDMLSVIGVCVIHVGSVSASAADRQREDRHHGMDEDCLIRIKMVSEPKYELA